METAPARAPMSIDRLNVRLRLAAGSTFLSPADGEVESRSGAASVLKAHQ